MKVLKISLLSLVTVFATVNCKIKFNGSGDIVDIYDDSSLSDRIDYVYQAGYMVGPTEDDNISLSLVRTGHSVQGSAVGAACQATAKVDLAEFSKLDALIKNAQTTLGQGILFDGGTEYVDLTSANDVSRIFLKNGSGSFKKPVMNSADAENVRARVDAIAERILADCTHGSSDIKSVWLQQNLLNQVVVDPPPPTNSNKNTPVKFVNYTTINDLHVDIGQSSVRVHGYREIRSEKSDCKTSVDTRVSNPQDWINAINMIKIQSSDVVCMIAQQDGPQMLTLYHNSGASELGYFGCQFQDRVIGGEQFLKLMDDLLARQDQLCLSAQ
ncbi:MAG: hypothetical protein H6623_04320 [Bdellovibrionaceae bacterium]|nr:hypothetical protein [Pseudobdellovibrionaceae bacterium]